MDTAVFQQSCSEARMLPVSQIRQLGEVLRAMDARIDLLSRNDERAGGDLEVPPPRRHEPPALGPDPHRASALPMPRLPQDLLVRGRRPVRDRSGARVLHGALQEHARLFASPRPGSVIELKHPARVEDWLAARDRMGAFAVDAELVPSAAPGTGNRAIRRPIDAAAAAGSRRP
jgi:hypothetical protein